MSEEIKFKSLVIKESDREFTRQFGESGSFTVRIPLPYQKTAIISATSRATGNAPIESLTVEEREYTRMIVTLNSVIVKSPDWWKGAETCPNDDFLEEVWTFYLDSEKKFLTELKKNTEGKVLGKP